MPDILTKQDGPILHITLNQPGRGNAVSDEMVAELTGIIAGAEKTSSVVVLRGAGADFCVGRAVMGAAPTNDPDAYERRAFSDVVFDCYGAMRNAKVPIIAVVQGRALGFGCAIAAACDITLASDQGRVPSAGNGAQYSADHGDVVLHRPAAAQGDQLSGLFDRRDHAGAGLEFRHCQ